MGDRRHWLEWGLIAGLGAEVIRLHYGKELRDWWKEWRQKPKRKRQLHPRTPEDCPFCQAYEPEWVHEQVVSMILARASPHPSGGAGSLSLRVEETTV